MIQINKIYGILTDGEVNAEYCQRYTNVTRLLLDEKHREYLHILLPETLDAQSLAVNAELIVQFMMSGETWPEFMNEFDPHNTYDQRLDIAPSTKALFLTADTLKKWIARNPFLTEQYPIEASGSFIEKLMNTLYSFFSTVHK